MGRRVCRRHILGYSVCLCPIKRTSGLYELMNRVASLIFKGVRVQGYWWEKVNKEIRG